MMDMSPTELAAAILTARERCETALLELRRTLEAADSSPDRKQVGESIRTALGAEKDPTLHVTIMRGLTTESAHCYSLAMMLVERPYISYEKRPVANDNIEPNPASEDSVSSYASGIHAGISPFN